MKALDQARISRILGSTMQPVRGRGLGALVAQYVQSKASRKAGKASGRKRRQAKGK